MTATASNSDVASKIISSCESEFPSNSSDCNHFLKAVANHFFKNDIFKDLNANQIVDYLLNPSNGWQYTRKISSSISAAKEGSFVIAGRSSNPNGHVAIVIGVDGQLSGSVIVPIGYAGSISGHAIAGLRLSETFNKTLVQQEQIDYFIKSVETIPNFNSAMKKLVRVTKNTKIKKGTTSKLR